jgi:hypothetical protein
LTPAPAGATLVPKRTMRGRRLSVLLAGLVLAWLAAAPADANHIAGATYTGTVTGGGTVELRVAADGSAVTYFKVAGIPGFPNKICGLEASATFNAPITNHAFSFGLTGLRLFAGSFPQPRIATGTVEDSFCFNGPRTWTATTNAAPPPTTTQPPAPASPPPFFLGGNQRVKLVRKSPTLAVVDARFRICGGKKPLRLLVTQRRREGKQLVADSSFSRPLAAGKSAPAMASGIPCADYATSWTLAAKFFGAGWITITVRVVDAAGAKSLAPQFALRAPTP